MNKFTLFFKGFKIGMKNFESNISIIVNSFLLLLVYFIGVGVTSIFLRIFNKSLIQKNIPNNSKTYWGELNLKKNPFDEYYRQF